MAIHLLSAELVDVVLEYGIRDTNPPAIEGTHTYDLAANVKSDNVEKLEVVILGLSNAKSEPEANTPRTAISNEMVCLETK